MLIVRGGPTLIFFLVNEGRKDPAGHHRPAFCWRADDGPTLNSGLVALGFFRDSGPVLLRNPKFLRFFRGVRNPFPPLDLCMSKTADKIRAYRLDPNPLTF